MKTKQGNITALIHDDNIYTYDDIESVLDRFDIKSVSRNHIRYLNAACSFDIETSSFYLEGEKQSCMYIWMFNFSGITIIGRTWNEFTEMLDRLVRHLGLSLENRLVCYIHNLQYEFQWFRRWLQWESVFALSERKVVKTVTTSGIEFRCSYILTNKNLKSVAEDLPEEFNGIAKLTGELDYMVVRGSQTSLTQQELQYCINDVLIVTYFIYDKLVNENNIAFIPLTATGYVRKAVRKNCLYNKNDWSSSFYYKKYISKLTMTEEDYNMLKLAFMGGFTHASCLASNMVLTDVGSIDFTSCYPAEMIKEQFPDSKFFNAEITSMKEFRRCLKVYCCLFEIEFINIRSSVIFEHVISYSKCSVCEDALIDNGRVVEASRIRMVITEQDFFVFEKYYEWDDIRIGKFKYAYKNYLPTLFVESVLDFYKQKTELKGVPEEERNYLLAKANVNSLYGMSVTDPCRASSVYDDDEWFYEIPDYEEKVKEYNESKGRFINYAWGIWVTAYARRDLLMSIYDEFQDDYVYADTDSIKFRNIEKHLPFIDKYNEQVRIKMRKVMEYHKLPLDSCEPLTIKGEPKHLGFFDYEGKKNMKTLGAKRYLTEVDGHYDLTCSGLNSQSAGDYIASQKDPFKFFRDGMKIPPEFTGKLTHTYIDCETEGTMIDCQGNEFRYHELSSVHLEPQDYQLGIGRMYADYLKGVQTHYEK